jgi:tetratricopeptide (TPR) repeat protein
MRASALQAMGRTEDALAAVDRAIAMADKFSDGWLARGRVLELLGRNGEARAAFARFLELQPSGAVADEVRKKLGP